MANHTMLHDQEYPIILTASIDPDGELKHIKAKLVPRELMSGKYVTTPAYRLFIDQHTITSREQIAIIRKRCHIRKHNPFQAISKQLNSWINNTFHGIGMSYMQDYLDEFCFRLNMKLQQLSAPWELLANYCVRVRS